MRRAEMRTDKRAQQAPVGINVAVGMVVMLSGAWVATTVSASAGWWRMAPLTLALLAVGALTEDIVATTVVATIAFLVVTGFLVNGYGELSWHGMTDVYRLLAVLGAGVVGAAGRAGWRRAWARRLVVPAIWGAEADSSTQANKEQANKEQANKDEETLGG
jgi:hypothetical protein